MLRFVHRLALGNDDGVVVDGDGVVVDGDGGLGVSIVGATIEVMTAAVIVPIAPIMATKTIGSFHLTTTGSYLAPLL